MFLKFHRNFLKGYVNFKTQARMLIGRVLWVSVFATLSMSSIFLKISFSFFVSISGRVVMSAGWPAGFSIVPGWPTTPVGTGLFMVPVGFIPAARFMFLVRFSAAGRFGRAFFRRFSPVELLEAQFFVAFCRFWSRFAQRALSVILRWNKHILTRGSLLKKSNYFCGKT